MNNKMYRYYKILECRRCKIFWMLVILRKVDENR